jgi:ankyrin repeat protein
MPAIREDWFEAEKLHRAAQEGDMAEMAALVNAGCKLSEFDDLSKTPLHYAVEGEHYKAAEWLLKMGAEVDAHQEELIGETALCQAARQNYPELVELLLKYGANPDLPGWMQITVPASGRTAGKTKKAKKSPLSSRSTSPLRKIRWPAVRAAPNPSIERTSQGLRPCAASHVKR